MSSTTPDNTRECPSCSRQIEVREVTCPFCGHVFVTSSATKALEKEQQTKESARYGSAKFNQRMQLILKLNEPKREFSFDPAGIDILVIGRRDPITGETPALDLADCDGERRGVSRRHAHIKHGDARALVVVDQGSVNGTWLNGQKLIAHQARILRDGDELRLGGLVLNVSFKKVEE